MHAARIVRRILPRTPLAVAVVIAQILAGGGPGLAAERPDFLSLSLGRAAADLTLETPTGDLDTGWSGGGKIIQLTVGRQVLSNVVVEAGYGVWRRSPESADATTPASADDVDRYLGAGTLVANIYSDLLHLESLALRVGLGFGKGYAAASGSTSEEWGVLALVGALYEWTVEHDFSVGVKVDYGYFGGRPALGGTVASASLFAKLLFPRHL